MIVKDAAKDTLIEGIVKLAILGIPLLLFRFVRWGGLIGAIGIAMFIASFVIVNRGSSSDSDSERAGYLMIAGIAVYIVGVVLRRRRRSRLALAAAAPTPQ